MNQTKLESLTEVVINVAIGWIFALITQIIAFPLFGIHITMNDQLGISAIFTVVSIVRGYIVRRWFNAGIHRVAVELIKNLQKNKG